MKNILNFSNVNCKHCYKCIRYCPVKAIKMEKDQAYIVEDLCIGCGNCFKRCPQDAKKIKSDLGEVKEYIKLGYKVVASIAPSFVGDLNELDYGLFLSALKKIGFYKVEETIVGAKMITEEYKKYINENKQEIYISTCCPTINYFITKYHGEMSKYLIPVESPMIAHGKYLKEKYGQDTKVVFIGPCISKKYEALEVNNRGIIDKVLTFEEVLNWIEKNKINMSTLEESDFDNPPLGDICLFPIEEGLNINSTEIDTMKVSGLYNTTNLIESIEKGELKNVFIELNACRGSCVGGIGFKNKKGIHYRQKKVKDYTRGRDLNESFLKELKNTYESIDLSKEFKKEELKLKKPEEWEIRDILISIGKKTVKDELNCGACGYDTCREKAIAVYRGLAEPDMCMPYMKDRLEALSGVIFEITPNYIVIVGEDFKIIDINRSMTEVINKDRKELIGSYIGDYIDINYFINALYNRRDVLSKRMSWKECNKELIGNIINLKEHNALIGIYSDITSEENQKEKFKEVKINTINTAQRVIEKQMRVAQEIASLMGETTAETKVILTRLKELAMKGDEED